MGFGRTRSGQALRRNHKTGLVEAANLEIEIDVNQLQPRYASRQWLDTGRNWTHQDKTILRALCSATTDVARAADVLGRKPESLARYARDSGLSLPQTWSRLITPKRLPIEARYRLAYPYVIRSRPTDADLLRVNDLVPKAFPEHMRADICQSVMLAFYEGTVSLYDLESNKKNLRFFIKRFYQDQSPFQETQFYQTPDDDRSFEDVAAARGLRDPMQERIIHSHSPATQEDHVYHRELAAIQYGLIRSGENISKREIENEIADRNIKIRSFASLYRYHIGDERFPTHARDRFKERFGVTVDDNRAEAILTYCRSRKPDFDSLRTGDGEQHNITWGGRSGYIVYRRKTDTVVSVIALAEFDPTPLKPHVAIAR